MEEEDKEVESQLFRLSQQEKLDINEGNLTPYSDTLIDNLSIEEESKHQASEKDNDAVSSLFSHFNENKTLRGIESKLNIDISLSDSMSI